MKYTVLLCFLVCMIGCVTPVPVAPPAAIVPLEILNTHCPIMGGEIDGETFVHWKGNRLGFCCPPCIGMWEKLTQAERVKKLSQE